MTNDAPTKRAPTTARTRTRRFLPMIASGLSLLLAGPPVVAAPVTLAGSLTNAGTSYTPTDLQALGNTSVTIGVDQFTGVPLWTLLGGNAAGTVSNVVTTVPPGGNTNNPQLRYAVTATGADGSTSLL